MSIIRALYAAFIALDQRKLIIIPIIQYNHDLTEGGHWVTVPLIVSCGRNGLWTDMAHDHLLCKEHRDRVKNS